MTSSKSSFSPRRSARLAAVQALYQLDQSQDQLNKIVAEFITYRFPNKREGDFHYFKPDVELFKSLTNGVTGNLKEIDELIESNLMQNWRLERLPNVMLNLLRAACFELKYESLVPTPVIINEYIEITKDFFPDTESSFVNGILDVISKKVREI
ncbi:MAG: transcription antitermination factor NusB [Alphaproteobacteria bacterium]|nr:transcription antitermination factor NusB [Alphaproteobacteria bacterium]